MQLLNSSHLYLKIFKSPLTVSATTSLHLDSIADLSYLFGNLIDQIHTAPLPNRSTADLPEKGTNVQMATTLQFDSPFLLSNGYYNMSVSLCLASDYLGRLLTNHIDTKDQSHH